MTGGITKKKINSKNYHRLHKKIAIKRIWTKFNKVKIK